MAVQAKLKSKGPLLIIIIGVILLIMCVISLCSCCEVQSQEVTSNSEINPDVTLIKIKFPNVTTVYIREFEYDNHKYMVTSDGNALIHSYSCPCLKETKVESSSLLDSSPSSLFNW